MWIFKLITGVIAVASAFGGYLSFKYSTTSTCEAAKKAIEFEAPEAIDELAETDPAIRLAKAGGALFGAERQLEAQISVMASEEVEDKSALECGYMVIERELSPSSFRDSIADDLKAKLGKLLG